MILSDQKKKGLTGHHTVTHRGTGMVGSRDALTGQYGGEEDVVREGDEATLPQGVKDAVLVCKLLPFLGNLLLVQVAKKKRKMKMTH